jgi:catalase-peroxidase
LIGHIGVSLLSCATGEFKWRGRRLDLVLGSNYQFRAVAEVYACADSQEKFVRDFVVAWTKVIGSRPFRHEVEG